MQSVVRFLLLYSRVFSYLLQLSHRLSVMDKCPLHPPRPQYHLAAKQNKTKASRLPAVKTLTIRNQNPTRSTPQLKMALRVLSFSRVEL
jgi:hypothetical protein